MVMKMHRLLPVLGLACLTGCSHDRELARNELNEISAQHEIELQEFKESQDEFLRRNPMPRKLEFAGQGTLLLHECTLEGYPGHEELWLRYTYVNTTGHTIDAARVTITLTNPETRAEWSDTTELTLPISFRLTPESSYTTYAHVPTHGVQSNPKWEWKIRAEAVVRG
jgi:hypothetical protein